MIFILLTISACGVFGAIVVKHKLNTLNAKIAQLTVDLENAKTAKLGLKAQFEDFYHALCQSWHYVDDDKKQWVMRGISNNIHSMVNHTQMSNGERQFLFRKYFEHIGDNYLPTCHDGYSGLLYTYINATKTPSESILRRFVSNPNDIGAILDSTKPLASSELACFDRSVEHMFNACIKNDSHLQSLRQQEIDIYDQMSIGDVISFDMLYSWWLTTYQITCNWLYFDQNHVLILVYGLLLLVLIMCYSCIKIIFCAYINKLWVYIRHRFGLKSSPMIIGFKPFDQMIRVYIIFLFVILVNKCAFIFGVTCWLS